MISAAVVTVLMSTVGVSPLSLRIDAPETRPLPMEPVKIVVRWSAIKPIKTVHLENEDFSEQSLEFVVSAGDTERVYHETPRSGAEQQIIAGGLEPGSKVTTNLVLVYGAYQDAQGPEP